MFIKKKNIKHFLEEYLNMHKEDGYIITDIEHLSEFLERKLWHLLVTYKVKTQDEEIELRVDGIIENVRKIKK